MSNGLMTAQEYFGVMRRSAVAQAKPKSKQEEDNDAASAAATFDAVAAEMRRRAEEEEARAAEEAAKPKPKPQYHINIGKALSVADFMPITAAAPKLGRSPAQALEDMKAVAEGRGDIDFDSKGFDMTPRATIGEIWVGGKLVASVNLYGAVTMQRSGINLRTGEDISQLTEAEIVDRMPTITKDGRVLGSKELQLPVDAEQPAAPFDRGADGRLDEGEALDAMRAEDGNRSGPTLAYHRLQTLTRILRDAGQEPTVKQFDPISGKSAAGETPVDPHADARAKIRRLFGLQREAASAADFGAKAI